MASVINVTNETENEMSRVTQDGRHLTYEVKVIQQPERARACGSGAKSSADRRPVDPPPVVELRIYEVEGDTKTDVTFSHNANFFLFTTLENARPIAKGRLPIIPPTFPVLTGSPVAGMAYLDRPSPAGYFIFPDLSVRHEGLYRLAFSLYEELKESKDADVEPPEGSPKTRDELLMSHPMAPRAHVHYRLEVKSVPFAVYSAKKFPGLAESTPLSRTVAEQGCRVRIRRDVRMRRRDKASDGYPEYDEDNSYPHSEQYATPQQGPDRPRSISNGSIDAHTPYSTGRRSSMQDLGYFPQANYPPANFQQPPPSAPTHSASTYGSSHLSFGGSTTPQYATPTFPLQQAPQQPAQVYMQNNNPVPYPPGLHARQMSASQNYGYHQPQPQPQATSYHQPQLYTDSTEYRPVSDHRRSSAGMTANHHQAYLPNLVTSNAQSHPPLQPYYHASQPSSRTSTPNNANVQGIPQLPPLRTSQQSAIEPKFEPSSPASRTPQQFVSSVSYPSSYNAYSPQTSQSADSMPGRPPKRAFDNVFSTQHLQQSMHSGMRPSTADQGQDLERIETDTGEVEEAFSLDQLSERTLIYKRADGSQQAKKCPSPIDGSGYRRRGTHRAHV
ncbi:velvet protein [Mycoblastus sanguinarius]|nr:velvet protein [Mycoblastus sanguinarius]